LYSTIYDEDVIKRKIYYGLIVLFVVFSSLTLYDVGFSQAETNRPKKCDSMNRLLKLSEKVLTMERQRKNLGYAEQHFGEKLRITV
jgi:hypothetical protein